MRNIQSRITPQRSIAATPEWRRSIPRDVRNPTMKSTGGRFAKEGNGVVKTDGVCRGYNNEQSSLRADCFDVPRQKEKGRAATKTGARVQTLLKWSVISVQSTRASKRSTAVPPRVVRELGPEVSAAARDSFVRRHTGERPHKSGQCSAF
jgi:hypothetical protein